MLERMSLAGNRFSMFESLQPLDSLPALKELDLFYNAVTESAGYREGIFEMLPSLIYLDGFDRNENEKDEDEEEDLEEEEDEDEEEPAPMCVRTDEETAVDKGRAFALAMATHPRLGANSPASWLHSDLLRRIATLSRLSHSRRLVALHVRAGNHVDRIELRYTDGSARICGGTGGVWRDPFLLSPGESIVRIKMWAGDALDSIKFFTSHGRSSPRYGGPGGSPCADLLAPSGQEILSLRMRRTYEGWLAPPLNQFTTLAHNNIEMDLVEVPSATDVVEMDAYFGGFKALYTQPPKAALSWIGLTYQHNTVPTVITSASVPTS